MNASDSLELLRDGVNPRRDTSSQGHRQRREAGQLRRPRACDLGSDPATLAAARFMCPRDGWCHDGGHHRCTARVRITLWLVLGAAGRSDATRGRDQRGGRRRFRHRVDRDDRDGLPWAAKTVLWNGADLSVTDDAPSLRAARANCAWSPARCTHRDPETPGAWGELGSPDSIDPGSGTTPDDYLKRSRADVGGVTLRRITESMTGLSTARTETVARSTPAPVPAGVLAPETGLKEGI